MRTNECLIFNYFNLQWIVVVNKVINHDGGAQRNYLSFKNENGCLKTPSNIIKFMYLGAF